VKLTAAIFVGYLATIAFVLGVIFVLGWAGR
jgi:hypothetical protein